MKIIVCLDDHLGYAFNNRKQSSDRYMEEHLGGKMETFQGVVSIDYDEATEAEWIWIQTGDFPENIREIDELILYRWNRTYPYDKKLPEGLLDSMELVEKEEFEGYSHDLITYERYARESGEAYEE